MAEHLSIEREVDPPEPGRRQFIQVVGARGAGKTSLLLHWRRRLDGPYIHVEAGRARWRPVPIAPIAYWDGAGRIPRVILRRALTAAAGAGATIVIGTHADRGSLGRQAGMMVRSIRLPPPTAATVQVWAARCIAAVTAVERPPALTVDEQLAASVAAECGGSWRVVRDLLHSWAAAQANAATRDTG